MRNEFAKMAYRQKPVPDSLPESERPAYRMLSALYRLYDAGKIDLKTAEALKEPLMQYPDIPTLERAALLRYFFLSAFKQTRSGNVDAWKQAQLLIEEYFSLPLDRYEHN